MPILILNLIFKKVKILYLIFDILIHKYYFLKRRHGSHMSETNIVGVSVGQSKGGSTAWNESGGVASWMLISTSAYVMPHVTLHLTTNYCAFSLSLSLSLSTLHIAQSMTIEFDSFPWRPSFLCLVENYSLFSKYKKQKKQNKTTPQFLLF